MFCKEEDLGTIGIFIMETLCRHDCECVGVWYILKSFGVENIAEAITKNNEVKTLMAVRILTPEERTLVISSLFFSQIYKTFITYAIKTISVPLFLPLNNVFFFQAGIGLSANFFLVFFHIFTLLNHRPEPTDLITCHLPLVQIMMLLIVLWLLSPDLFNSLFSQNDLKYKVFFYMYRVRRSLSIYTTCFLTMTQAITISPSTSCLSSFKHKFTNYVIYIFVFSWCHSLPCSSYLIFYTVASSNVNQTQLLSLSKLCSLSPTKSIIHELFSTLKTSCDITFIGIVLRSSAYMVILLFKPHRWSQHLHITNFSPRVSPEERATHTIMLLVSFFAVMYWMNLMSSLAILFWVNNSVILGIQKLVVNVYATVSPSVLIISDTRITNILQFMQWKCHPFLKS